MSRNPNVRNVTDIHLLLISSLSYHNLQTSCSFIVTYFTFNIDVFILTHYPIQWITDCIFLKLQFHHTITELEWMISIRIDFWLAFHKSSSGIMTECNAKTHTHTYAAELCTWHEAHCYSTKYLTEKCIISRKCNDSRHESHIANN